AVREPADRRAGSLWYHQRICGRDWNASDTSVKPRSGRTGSGVGSGRVQKRVLPRTAERSEPCFRELKILLSTQIERGVNEGGGWGRKWSGGARDGRAGRPRGDGRVAGRVAGGGPAESAGQRARGHEQRDPRGRRRDRDGGPDRQQPGRAPPRGRQRILREWQPRERQRRLPAQARSRGAAR